MGTITKPYGDFNNNVDVADASKVNQQINTLYTWANGNVDLSNINASALATTPTAGKIAKYDSNANLPTSYPVSANQNPNLLFNPSARLGLNGWTVIFGGAWSAAFGINFGEGGYFQSPTNGNNVLQSQKIPISASQTLSISGELNTAGLTAGSAWIEIDAFNASDTNLGSNNAASLSIGQNWTKVSTQYTTPANTTYVLIRLVTASGSTGNALFRKIKVEYGAIATTFSDDNTLNTIQYGTALGLAQVLSGGYKVQSATAIASTTPGATGVQSIGTFNLPNAFSSSSFLIVPFVTSGMPTVRTLEAQPASASSFTLYADVGTASASFQFGYIAIGT